MAETNMVELIIKIPEEVKNRLCFGVTYPKDIQVMSEALNNSTPLSKIRTKIEKLEYLNIEDGSDGYDKYIEKYEVLRIIDECKAESLDARLRENDDLER